MKRAALFILVTLMAVSALSACRRNDNGSDSLDGTWNLAPGAASEFSTFIFEGENVRIPPTTNPVTMAGSSITFEIADGELIVNVSAGISYELMRLDFRRDGNSIFLDGVEYIRQD